jgi:hypothetical protein
VSVASTARPTAAGSSGTASVLDRALAALPLLTVFSWFALVYAWQAWLVSTPFVFSDELELTQLARSLAETGEAARRGAAYGLVSLPTVLTAPAWRIDDVEAAYTAAKLIGALAMTAAVFPAYALARLLVPPRAALYAAAGSIAIPAFMYSSLLLHEPFAYTASTLCLFLMVLALARPGVGTIGAAVLAVAAAPFVRSQLAVLPAIFALAAALVVWTSEPLRRRRAGWTRWDWVGAVTLATGAVVVVNEVLSHQSFAWLVATRHYKDRMVELGIAASGALTIGLGVLPVLVGLALLVRPRGEPWSPERRAFAAVLVASIVGFVLYASVKATFLSTVFATRYVERNVIYLAPLFFVATALWLRRSRVQPLALAGAIVVVGLVLAHTPLVLDFPYFEAPGFALLAAANRTLALEPSTIASLVPLVAVVAALLVLAAALLTRRPAARAAVVGVAAALVLGWNVLGQLYASQGARESASFLLSGYAEPRDWVDRAAGGEPVLYLGQGIQNPNPIHLLEFWNRSLAHVWSLDGTAPGPGPVLTPNLAGTNGELAPDPGVRLVVADAGVNLVGEVVAEQGPWRLYRIEPPLRLMESRSGVFADGWIGPFAAYSQFATPGGEPGTIEVTVSRAAWGGASPPAHVVIHAGPLTVGEDNQPALASAERTVEWWIQDAQEETFRIPSPAPPFRVEISIDPTFSPHELDPRHSDMRRLGAQVGFRFIPAGE